ncbi:MAG: hypothetical protein KGM95_05330 [Betaproteobacteria bacterium]|nr:hypothetical protein [Betaproteobacteria bacterium]
MKTARSLFLTLFVAASFSSSIAWAGEPNTDALSGQPKSDQSKGAPGGDCSAEMGQEISRPDAATLLE